METRTVGRKKCCLFEMKFLERQDEWKKYIKICQKVLELAMLFWDPMKDKRPPGM